MLEVALSLAAMAMVQSAQTTPADLPPQPAAATQDEPQIKRIFVKNSSEAARADIVDPNQEICVRTILPGSRVKARTVCQNQTSWKAYLEAQEAMNREWLNAAKGLPPETEFVGPGG